MNTKRESFDAAIKLGLVFSVVAIIIAAAASAVGNVSTGTLVALVAGVAFVTSWIQTDRLTRPSVRHHRVTVLPRSH